MKSTAFLVVTLSDLRYLAGIVESIIWKASSVFKPVFVEISIKFVWWIRANSFPSFFETFLWDLSTLLAISNDIALGLTILSKQYCAYSNELRFVTSYNTAIAWALWQDTSAAFKSPPK